MKIHVSDLPPEGVRLRSSESPKIIDIEEEEAIFEEPIAVDVFAKVVGQTLLVQGTIKAPAKLRCSRCLEYYKLTLNRPNYTFSTTVREGDIIDLTESIREDTIIAIPIKALCSGECRGLCSVCGQNRNEGPCGCSTDSAVPSVEE